MPTVFQPLIPARLTNPAQLRYPLYLSPKVDGVRCSLHERLGPITRAGHQLQNPHVRKVLTNPQLHGLDGEIVVGSPSALDVLTKTIATVVRGKYPTTFDFFVFDDFAQPALPFSERIKRAQARVDALSLPWLHMLPQWLVGDAAKMRRRYQHFLDHGFEGGILRCPQGRYKGGLATEASSLAIALKPALTVAVQREVGIARAGRLAPQWARNLH